MSRLVSMLCLGLAVALPAEEKSAALAYGPREQVVLTVNRGVFGAYAQPILRTTDAPDMTSRETGGRFGLLYSYSALTWKALECRAQVGAGSHHAWRKQKRDPMYEGDPGEKWESSQQGFELWIQPEFRFSERFALLLEGHFLRYLRETDYADREVRTVGFVTPDYSLGEVGFGIRYYLPFGRE